MRHLSVILAGLACMLIVGCSDSAQNSSAAKGTNTVSYAAMATNDVLVAVNGTALTKGEVEELVRLDAALLYLKGAIHSPKPDPRLKLRLAKRRQGQFISKVLLLQAAGEAGVVATSNDLEQAWNEIATGYGAPGDANPRATIQSQLRGKLRALLDREVESAALIGAFIAKSAAGKVSVDEAQVEKIIKRGGELKARSRRLLEEQREKARKLHARLEKGEDFMEVAAASDTAVEDESVGAWGEFTPAALDRIYPDLSKQVGELGVGEYTEPLELEDAIHIIRLEARSGAGAESAVTVDPLRWKLQRIVLKLPILYEVGTREQIRAAALKEGRQKFQTETLLPALFKKADILRPNGDVKFAEPEKED